MVHELDTVVITRDLAASGIVAGDIGVVAHLYADNSVAEVEFVSGAGTTLAVETLPITELGSYRRTESEERSRQHSACRSTGNTARPSA